MNLDYQTIMQQLPDCVCWKDMRSVFMGGNARFAHAAGLSSINEIPGKTDYDFPWSGPQTSLFRLRDSVVLSQEKDFYWYEQQRQADGKTVCVYVRKSPLLIQGKIVGLICQYHEVDNQPNATYKLTDQQILCITYAAQGLSAKQIARKMRLSSRTIEAYLLILKNKLRCQNIVELIAKSYQYGVL